MAIAAWACVVGNDGDARHRHVAAEPTVEPALNWRDGACLRVPVGGGGRRKEGVSKDNDKKGPLTTGTSDETGNQLLAGAGQS